MTAEGTNTTAEPDTTAQSPLDAAFEHDALAEHPEVLVGFVLAQILKRFGP
jgi:hypothetical protein